MGLLSTSLRVLLLAAPAAAPAPAADTALREVARQAVATSAEAVVTVRLTVKSRMVFQGQEHAGPEQTLEIPGTILTPAGLTAVSDFSSNPAGLFSQMPGGPTVETDTSEVKLVLKDGREVKARFVLRDQDLDLAFLVPSEPATFPAVALDKTAVPGLLDPLVYVYPLGRSLGRGLAASLTEVRAIVKKPRTFLVADWMDGVQALGCPAFDGKGRAVGLVVVRRAQAPPSGEGGVRQFIDMMSPVVLTAEDVLEVAAQATTAAAQPPAPANPAPAK